MKMSLYAFEIHVKAQLDGTFPGSLIKVVLVEIKANFQSPELERKTIRE